MCLKQGFFYLLTCDPNTYQSSVLNEMIKECDGSCLHCSSQTDRAWYIKTQLETPEELADEIIKRFPS